MAEQLRVFVSHSHEDDDFCRAIVAALRRAGADVWYDEHNLGSGQLMSVIQRQLGKRPVFVVILSKHAFASRWVKRETTWAYEMYDRDPSRLILPVTAGPITREDFSPQNEWLFLHDFKRIEAPNYHAYPEAEAARRLLRALALTPSNEATIPITPQPSESAVDLIILGRALNAQNKYAEALDLLDRATQLTPDSFEAWANLGYTLNKLKRYSEALPPHEHATMLYPYNATAWNRMGLALKNLNRGEEALTAYDHALAINPKSASAWNNKAMELLVQKRYEEAMTAVENALSLTTQRASAWDTKGQILCTQGHFKDALLCFDRALSLDPATPDRWRNKAICLRALGHTDEANATEKRARELG